MLDTRCKLAISVPKHSNDVVPWYEGANLSASLGKNVQPNEWHEKLSSQKIGH